MDTSEFDVSIPFVEANHTIDKTIDPIGDNLDNNWVPIMSSETIINSQTSLPTSDVVITDKEELPGSEPASPKTESKW